LQFRGKFSFFGKKKNVFYFLSQYLHTQLEVASCIKNMRGEKKRQIKKIKSIKEILSKNVEPESS
jgi:hypothetical protein